MALAPALLCGQQPQSANGGARRGIGIRLADWNVPVVSIDDPVATVHADVFLERKLDTNLAIENSVGLWRIITNERQALPPSTPVKIKSYIVPLLTSLKLYPLGEPGRIAPYIAGGVGLAFGIEHEGDNAIRGGGTYVITGFGVRGSAGVEIRITDAFFVSGSGRYQWLHFAEAVGGATTYRGAGAEGGVAYRFRF